MFNLDIDQLISNAESGKACDIYELARLYDLGAIPDPSESKYIELYELFFKTDEVRAVLNNLDSEKGYDDSVGFYEEGFLKECIVEAGLALCFYYMNSTDSQEVRQALEYVGIVYDVLKGPYEIERENGELIYILSIIKQLNERLEKMGVDYDAQ